MNRALQARSSDLADTFPALPRGMQRGDWLELVDDVAKPLRVGRAALQTLRGMVRTTRPRDWTSGASEPICYMAQSKLAKKIGISTSRLRAHQAELERAGLLKRNLGANGGRSGHAGLGVLFSCGIARVPSLCALREDLEIEAEKATHLRGQRSTRKGIARSLIETLTEAGACSEELAPHIQAFSSLVRADALHSMTLMELEQHVAEVTSLCDALQTLLEQYSETGGQPRETERPIQDTNQDSKLVTCTSAENRECPSEQPTDHIRPSVPVCAEPPQEAKPVAHTSDFLDKLTPSRLYALASEEMQLWLDVSRQDRPIANLRLLDLIMGAERRVMEIGIGTRAWLDAVDAMGPELAALCIMVIDANRSAPLPVRNPGGYLRGMIARFQCGQLNIVGSLIGLSERRRMAPAGGSSCA